MGMFFSLIVILFLMGVNMYAADALMRLRSDIQFIRRTVSSIARTNQTSKTPVEDDNEPKEKVPQDEGKGEDDGGLLAKVVGKR